MKNQDTILIYDDQCALCSSGVEFLRLKLPSMKFNPIGCNDPVLSEVLPNLPREECRRELKLMFPDGTLFGGADALRELLLLFRGLRWLAPIFHAGIFRRPFGWAYRRLAANRMLLSRLLARHLSRQGLD